MWITNRCGYPGLQPKRGRTRANAGDAGAAGGRRQAAAPSASVTESSPGDEQQHHESHKPDAGDGEAEHTAAPSGPLAGSRVSNRRAEETDR